MSLSPFDSFQSRFVTYLLDRRKTEKGLQINKKITITPNKIFDVTIKHDSQ